VIADLITGVRYTHQQGVIHGNILQENVLVTAQGRGKLQGLPTSAVQCEMSDSSGKLSHQQDFVAISQLGRSVLQEVPPKRRSEGYDTLVKIVGALASAEGSDLDKVQLKLAQWLAKYGPKQPVSNLAGASTIPLAKSVSGSDDHALAQDGGSDSPGAAPPATKLRKKEEAELEPEAEHAGFLAKMWNEKRALSLAAIAATVLTLVGGIGASGYLLTQPSSTGGGAVAHKDRNEKKPASFASIAAKETGSATANKSRKEFKLDNLAAGDGPLSAPRPKDALDPVANKRRIDEMLAKSKAAENPPAVTEPVAENNAPTKKAARRRRRREAAAEAAAKVASTVEVTPVPEKPEATKTVAATKSPANLLPNQ